MSMDNAAVNSRMVVILIIIVGLIAAVGVIISAVALGRPSLPSVSIAGTTNSRPLAADWIQEQLNGVSGQGGTAAPPGSKSKREVHMMQNMAGVNGHKAPTVWTVAMGADRGPHEYRDSEGTIQGFSSDIVHAVCSSLGLNCRVVYDAYQNCWTTTPNHYSSGGKGLLGQWYDACIAWTPSAERENVFDFSQAYALPSKAKLFVKKGNSLDLPNLGKQTIGFIRGFAEDESCLSRQSTLPVLPTEAVIYTDTPQEAAALLKAGKVSAVFATSGDMQPYLDDVIMAAGDAEYTCTDGGYSLMTRKDNNFLALWNIGFQKIKKDGLYKTICDNSARHGHRGNVKCMDL